MRFRKSIKIAPGLKVNLSKSGLSTTVGKKGASVNMGKDGVYLNTGIPGTGVYNRQKLADGSAASGDAEIQDKDLTPEDKANGLFLKAGIFLVCLAVVLFVMKHPVLGVLSILAAGFCILCAFQKTEPPKTGEVKSEVNSAPEGQEKGQ